MGTVRLDLTNEQSQQVIRQHVMQAATEEDLKQVLDAMLLANTNIDLVKLVGYFAKGVTRACALPKDFVKNSL